MIEKFGFLPKLVHPAAPRGKLSFGVAQQELVLSVPARSAVVAQTARSCLFVEKEFKMLIAGLIIAFAVGMILGFFAGLFAGFWSFL